MDQSKEDTSWQSGHTWYDSIVGEEGHYYHRHVILPRLLSWIGPQPDGSRFADLACGQGILERMLQPHVQYHGVDLSTGLLDAAHDRCAHLKRARFHHADVTKQTPLSAASFDWVTVILALQNMEHPAGCLQEVSRLLKPSGRGYLILNHPAFRIPTLSDWVWDREKNVMARRIDRYLSPLKIPLKVHPSQGDDSPVAWAYHLPLQRWMQMILSAGLWISGCEEWCSDKKSEGGRAAAEDAARKEFPLFLAFEVQKRS